MIFKDLYVQGMLEQQREKEKTDNTGELRYRGGNAGILYKGLPANSCARKMIARTHGRFEESAWNTQLMFDLGELNEDRWHKKLRAAGYTVDSADNLVQLATAKGRPITGSPDSIVVHGEDKYLIEHKHISSFWTFRSVVLENEPKLEHIAQASLYSHGLNDMKACILYTASVLFSGPEFLSRLVPKPLDPGSENFEYTYYQWTGETKMVKGKKVKLKRKISVPGHMNGMFASDLFKALNADFADFKNTIPTVVQYDLEWREDEVWYKRSDTVKWIKSPVTRQNILDFYNYTEECEEREELPARPLTLDGKGSAKGYSACDYCSLSDVCDKYERDYKVWLSESKKVRW